MAKVKHWQGYGSLDVKKLAEYPYGTGKKKTVLQVSGLHEYGVHLNNGYDIYNWLAKRFFPECRNARDMRSYNIVPMHMKDSSGQDIDAAIYEIEYWASPNPKTQEKDVEAATYELEYWMS